MSASSAYLNYLVVEPQFGGLIGLCPSIHVNLNQNNYNIRYRVLPVLILILLWLWTIGVQPFRGGWGPNPQADRAWEITVVVCSEF